MIEGLTNGGVVTVAAVVGGGAGRESGLAWVSRPGREGVGVHIRAATAVADISQVVMDINHNHNHNRNITRRVAAVVVVAAAVTINRMDRDRRTPTPNHHPHPTAAVNSTVMWAHRDQG